MEKCPKCGSTNTKPLKEWKMVKGLGTEKESTTKVTMHLCGYCGKKFRTAIKIA